MRKKDRDMGYAESLARWSFAEGKTWYDRSPRMQTALQLVLRINTRLSQAIMTRLFLTVKDQHNQLQTNYGETTLGRLSLWLIVCAMWLVNTVMQCVSHLMQQANTILPAVPLFLSEMLHNKNAPPLFSDMGYVLRHDMLPVAASMGASRLAYDAIQSEFIAEYVNPYLIALTMLGWGAGTACLISDVVVPRSVRFFWHMMAINLTYPTQFAKVSKSFRELTPHICKEKSCTTARYVKGEITETLSFAMQTIYLMQQQITWSLVAAVVWKSKSWFDEINARHADSGYFPMAMNAFLYLAILYTQFNKHYITFLNAMQLGDAMLRTRYSSDALCSRHRTEALNQQVGAVVAFGLLQLCLVSIIQTCVQTADYVPTFMLSSGLYVLFMGLAHYIQLPKPQAMSTSSLLVRQFSPLNQIQAQVSDAVDAVIREIRERCKAHVQERKHVRWTWQLLQHEMKQGRFASKINLLQRYFWLAKPALTSEFTDLESLLEDPIFAPVVVSFMSTLDQVCKYIIDYRQAVMHLTHAIDTAKQASKEVKKVPSVLRSLFSKLVSFTLGPVNLLLDPEFMLKGLPDGLDGLLESIQWVDTNCVSLPKPEWVSQLRESIQKYRKKRDFWEKILTKVPNEIARFIACYSSDDLFIQDLQSARAFLQKLMQEHHLEMYEDMEVIDLDMIAQYKEEMRRAVESAPSCQFTEAGSAESRLISNMGRFFKPSDRDVPFDYDESAQHVTAAGNVGQLFRPASSNDSLDSFCDVDEQELRDSERFMRTGRV